MDIKVEEDPKGKKKIQFKEFVRVLAMENTSQNFISNFRKKARFV